MMLKKTAAVVILTALAGCQTVPSTTGAITNENPPYVVIQQSKAEYGQAFAEEFKAQGYVVKQQNSNRVVLTKPLKANTMGRIYYTERSKTTPQHKVSVTFSNVSQGVKATGWVGLVMNAGRADQYDFPMLVSEDGNRLMRTMTRLASPSAAALDSATNAIATVNAVTQALSK